MRAMLLSAMNSVEKDRACHSRAKQLSVNGVDRA